jgi:Mrp family chromosome partitioning ATPase
MGRIAKELTKARKKQKRGTKSANTSKGSEGPTAITDSIDARIDEIDFSQLKNVVPDEDSLIKYRIVAAQADAPERSLYKVLRTRVLQRLRAARWNVIGVSGTGPGEGKTITAINLAYSLAQDVNHRVILVDLDLRRPSVHTYLGMDPRHDLSDYLNGTAKLEEILVRPDESRLAVLTNQTTYRDSSEVLSTPELKALVQRLRNLGPKTITVFDLPPALAGDDVLAFSPLIDAMLLVVAEGTCRREHLAETNELLKDIDILGTILNRSREKSPSGGDYDYY